MSDSDKWRAIREQFRLSPQQRQFATMVLASNPTTVTNAINEFRDALDVEGFSTFSEKFNENSKAIAQSLHEYFGVEPGCAALTYGTAMGLAQILGGVRVNPGQEILTSVNEHAATMEVLRFRHERDGTLYRQVPLFRDSRTVTADEIVRNIESALRPHTRVLALTWVYSSDGVQLPLGAISAVVTRENARRMRAEDQLLFVVDGVHGFGVEDKMFADLGCDFFISGCHKWIFGPRGTGIIAGRRDAWKHVVPMVATLAGPVPMPAFAHIPGGLVAFEHQWALQKAFEFHIKTLIKSDVHARVHYLAACLKAALPKVSANVVTPIDTELSSGVVCFDVPERKPLDVVAALKKKHVIASVSGWDYNAGRNHVRFSVSVLNSKADIDDAITALR